MKEMVGKKSFCTQRYLGLVMPVCKDCKHITSRKYGEGYGKKEGVQGGKVNKRVPVFGKAPSTKSSFPLSSTN